MKNVILSETESYTFLVKIYTDGSIRLIEKWKSKQVPDREIYITTEEIEKIKQYI